MFGECPGPFRGDVPLRLPVSCDGVHAALGLLSAAAPHRRVRALLWCVFVLYQAVEELPGGDLGAFVRDCTLYALGLSVGLCARRLVSARQ